MVIKRTEAGALQQGQDHRRHQESLPEAAGEHHQDRGVRGFRGALFPGTRQKEIDSKEIGERVINRLKEWDEVAYVRFASVYRQFRTSTSSCPSWRILKAKKEKEAPKKTAPAA